MPTPERLTELEYAIMSMFYLKFRNEPNFPDPENLFCSRREQSDVARCTYFKSQDQGFMEIDGDLVLGKYHHIKIDELPSGLTFSLYAESGKLKYLEMIVNGEYEWSGREDGWRIVDPETAE